VRLPFAALMIVIAIASEEPVLVVESRSCVVAALTEEGES
jgi:hypothetical protein